MIGDWRRGNYRLAPISRSNTVWCLQADSLELGECSFAAASGTWLDADGGRFALVGQAITRDGEPGGEWVIAAKISDDRTVPGVDPRLFTSGTSGFVSPGEGCELAGAAVLETGKSSSNATGLPLQHFCRLPVPTNSHPHPDGAQLVGGTCGPIFKYIGAGAALNDVNGREADETGHYYPGSAYAHVVWNSGYEVPAAKRPATYSWPPLINQNSPIVWRAVQSGALIGSDLIAMGCP
jgi:hypothetical protein